MSFYSFAVFVFKFIKHMTLAAIFQRVNHVTSFTFWDNASRGIMVPVDHLNGPKVSLMCLAEWNLAGFLRECLKHPETNTIKHSSILRRMPYDFDALQSTTQNRIGSSPRLSL